MRALRRMLTLAALVAATPASAQRFTAIAPSPLFGIDELQAVEIRLGDTVIKAPRTQANQLGFADTKISAGGLYAGWTPTEPNCCASYSMTSRLVVIDTRQHLHRFSVDAALWDWAFVESRDAVALLSATSHAPSWFVFELRAIASGRLLARYECPTLLPRLPAGYRRRPMPAWARTIAARADCDEWDKERAENAP